MPRDPNPVKCQTDVFNDGTAIVILAGPRTETTEAWVRKVDEEVRRTHDASKLDWHSFGGRDVVKHLGDAASFAHACDVIKRMIPELDAAYAAEQLAEPEGLNRWTGKVTSRMDPFTGEPYKLSWTWTSEARAIVDPEAQRKIDADKEAQWSAYQDRLVGKIAQTEYLVEADGFATQALWRWWHEDYGVPWEQDGEGMSREIGRLDGRPVCVTVFWVLIAGKRVGLWEATSQVVDYEMVETWLAATFPNARSKTNADNFGNVIHRIQHDVGRVLVKSRSR